MNPFHQWPHTGKFSDQFLDPILFDLPEILTMSDLSLFFFHFLLFSWLILFCYNLPSVLFDRSCFSLIIYCCGVQWLQFWSSSSCLLSIISSLMTNFTADNLTLICWAVLSYLNSRPIFHTSYSTPLDRCTEYLKLIWIFKFLNLPSPNLLTHCL